MINDWIKTTATFFKSKSPETILVKYLPALTEMENIFSDTTYNICVIDHYEMLYKYLRVTKVINDI